MGERNNIISDSMRLKIQFGLALLTSVVLLCLSLVSAVTINSGVVITTENATWTVADDFTLDEFSVYDDYLMFEDGNLSVVPNQTGVNITINSWTSNNENDFSIVGTGQNVTFAVNISGLGGLLWVDDEVVTEGYFPALATMQQFYYGQPFSINVHVRDELTNDYITENVTIFAHDTDYSKTFYTTTGMYNITDLPVDTFSITISSDNYTAREYEMTTDNVSLQTLNAYLTTATDEVQFLLKDKETGNVLEDATVTQQTYISGELVLISSQISDVVGGVVFTYNLGTTYVFTIIKEGYEVKVFELKPREPIYNVLVQPEDIANETIISDDVVAHLLDYDIRNNATSYAKVFFISPLGTLEYYSVTLAWANGTTTETGNNANGEELTASLLIEGAGYGERANVTITYKSTTNIQEVTRTFVYNIKDTEPTQGSIEGLRAENMGLSTVWLVILGTIITLFIAGAAAGAGSLMGEAEVVGGLVGMVMAGIFTYLGWFPWYSMLIIGLVGTMLISSRLTGGKR